MTTPRRARRPALDRLDGRVLLSTGLTPSQVRSAYAEGMNFHIRGGLGR